ncbi:ferric-chelate reductase [Phlyctema vagabunda]|uniref:Ferric-chelate reductase n=1 Tax=Phlyctema vagabunda TaxID=108571 RepID=A0ABR4P4C2_9HELO
MRSSLLLLITLSTFIWARSAPTEFCFGACQQILRSVHFNETNPGINKPCRNEFEIPSLYICAKLHCNPDQRERSLVGLNKTCLRRNATLPSFSIIDKYTDDDISKLRRLQSGDTSRPDPLDLSEVVVPSEKLYELAYDTLDAAYFERQVHWLYGFYMYVYWAMVITVGVSTHLISRIIGLWKRDQQWQPISTSDGGGLERTTVKRKLTVLSYPYTWIKRFITVPATFGYKRSQNIRWCTIPTRIQSMTIGVFILLNVVLCSISYRVFEDNVYWADTFTQSWRYLSDRTGIISLANLPLIWAFGVRNNTLLWLTGWDFATYNNFHRWVARVATVEAVVHSVGYTVLILEGDFWPSWRVYIDYYWHTPYFIAGEFATIFMVGVCVFSVYGLRRSFYEVFLIVHIVLSILILITMWYHVEIFHGEYNGFIWPCVFIWVLDRAMRLLRILSFNLRFWNTKAYTTYDSTSNIVRLVVPYSTAFIDPRPGTYYYIYVLNDLRIWESHPFTLGYSTSDEGDLLTNGSTTPSLGTITPPTRVQSPAIHQRNPTSVNRSSSEMATLLGPSSTTPKSSLVFVIRPYDGFTARLRESAHNTPANLRVLIEGPYGETQPFHSYQNVLFIVGGTGIAVPLSYLDKLLAEGSSTTSVRIIWAVREHEFLSQAIQNDFRGAFESDKISMEAYVTRPSDADNKDQELNWPKQVHVHHGRPSVYQEVDEAARDASNHGLAVVACGPGQMADDARRAVVRVLGKGYSQVEYFEESFNW